MARAHRDVNDGACLPTPPTRSRTRQPKARAHPRRPTLGYPVEAVVRGLPPHRLVAIGDSLTHGFQSGAIYNTELSYPAITSHELGYPWASRKGARRSLPTIPV